MTRVAVERFYAAFARLDGAAMQACYAPDATFDDEVFSLKGQAQIGGMWRMLCDTAKGMAQWKLVVSDITAHSAHWEAHYMFSATGRLVHNKVDAAFTFDGNGRITTHRDCFDFWTWSRQALGAPGLLLGWSSFLRNKVRAQAAASLQRFLAKS